MASNGGRINFQVGFNVDKSGLNSLKSSLQSLQKMKITDFSGTNEELRQIKNTAKQVQQALQKAFNTNLGSLNISKFNQELQKSKLNVNQIYSQFSKAGAQGQAAFSKMAQSVLTTNLQLRQTNSLVSKMGTTLMNTIKWNISSSIVQNFTNSIRQAFQYVQALDASLTDIRIVTGDSTEQMREFAKQANNAAQNLGRSTMDYTKAALTFYQQGLDDQSVAARTQATLQAQNITGAGEEMADYLTAVWNGYKVANEQAQLYVDRLAAVADSSASNMAQLATAMSKVASTANAMGVDVDQLNAQIATIIATTRQAPQTVGNALKTIFARINDIQAGTQDAEISLGNYTGKMAQLGISVLDASGHLRDTGQVMEEIGQKWQTMSREQQIYLARTMAGQRQYNNLIALFDNWGRYTELVNVSMDSQGTLMEKNSRYMDSLGAKMEQLGAAGEKVKDALINEQDMKGLIGGTTSAVNVLGSFIQSIGGARGMLLGLGSIATSVFSGTIAKEINNVIVNFQNLKANAQTIVNDIKQTYTMAASQGYQEGVIKEMVDAKTQIISLYGVMSNEQINSYNNIVKQVGEEKNLQLALDESVESAKKLENSFAQMANTTGFDISEVAENAAGALQNLNTSLLNIKNSESNLSFEQLKNQINTAIQAMGAKGTPAVEKFEQSLRRIQSGAVSSANQIGALSRAAQVLYNSLSQQYDNYANLQNLQRQADNAKNKVQQLKQQLDQIAQGKEQLFNVQNAVQFVGAIGRVSSGISNIVNLTKIWKNENLSTGEKVLQTFTNLGFTIPMIATGIGSIRKAILSTAISRQMLAKKAIADAQMELAQDSAKLALEKSITAEKALQAYYDGKMGVSFDLQQKLIKNVTKAHNDLMTSAWGVARAEKGIAENSISTKGIFQANIQSMGNAVKGLASKISGIETANLGLAQSFGIIGSMIAPVAIAAGAAVAAGVALYMVYTKSARQAEKAAAAAQKAKQQYEQIKQTYDGLKQSLQDYHSAQDALDQLTRGTQEWRDALLEANEAVLQLLNTYPQLAQYVTNQSGRLTISEAGQQALLESQFQQVQTVQRASSALAAQSRQASIRNQAVQLSRQVSGSDYNRDQIIALATEVARSGEAINYAAYADTSWVQSLREEALNEFNQLVQAIQANTTAIEVANQSLVQTAWQDNDIYQGFTEAGKEVATAIGSAAYQAEVDRIYQQLDNNWITRATGADSAINAAGDTLQSWLNEYNAAMGTNATFGSNAVVKDKDTGLLMINLLDEAGEAFQVTQQQMQMTIATARVMSQVEGSTLQQVREVNNSILSSGYGDALNKWLTGNLGDLTEDQLSELSSIAGQLPNIFGDDLDLVAQAVGSTTDEISNDLVSLVQQQRDSLLNYLKDLTPSVQAAFDNIDLGDLTINQQKQVAQNLAEAFREGGADALESLQDFYNGISDFDALDEVNESFNFTTGTTDQLREAFQQAGIATEFTNQQLQTYINRMRQAGQVLNPQETYAALHQIINDLAFNNTISGDDADLIRQTLEANGLNMSDYFQHMADGSYRLRANAQEFYDLINGFSLDPFEQAIGQVQERINTLSNWEANDYSATNLGEENFNQFSESARSIFGQIDQSLFEAQWTFLSGILDSLDESQQDFLRQLQNNYTEEDGIFDFTQLSREDFQQISEIISDHQAEWLNTSDAIEAARQQLNDYEEQISSVTSHEIDSDINTEQLDQLADYYSQYARDLNQIANTVQGNRQVALDLAEAQLRYNEAVERTVENSDEWLSVLQTQNEESATYRNTLDELQNTYGDLLNLPYDSELSRDFLKDAENLALLQQAINGSEQAYAQLQARANEDIITHLSLSQQDLAAFNADLDNIQSYLDSINFQDLEIGAELDDEAFLNQLSNMVNAAGMTAQQATDYLANMGIDAEVVTQNTKTTGYQQLNDMVPQVKYDTIEMPVFDFMNPRTVQLPVPHISYSGSKRSQPIESDIPATALRVTSAHKSSGGNFKFNHSNRNAGGGSRGGGGGGGRGGSSKAATPSVQKPSQDTRDPYHDINRLLEKQEEKLKTIQKQDKKLVNRDRLDNINAQNKALEEQANLLENKLAIAESQEIRLRNQLLADTNGYAQFGANGQITNFNQMLANAEKQYNDYIAYYNTLSKQQQDAEKDRLDLEKERYQRVKKTADEYEKTLDLQRDLLEQINEAQEKIYQNMIKQSQIRIDLAVDTGDLEREYLDFENKFIKKLDKDDFLGNAKANVKELMSYFNSDQIKKRNEEINSLNAIIQRIEKHGGGAYVDPSTGYNLAAAQERLSELFKDQTKALEEIDDLVKEIQELYLDSLKNAKDKMDDQIDQYERVGELLEHNAKLAQLIYGDKAYATLEKYYNLQQQNDERALRNLRMQQQYWQSQLDNEVVGSEAWLEIKKNLDDVTDDLNDKLEDIIDRLADQWQVRAKKITDQMNNALTGGRGLDYLGEQWDYISDYDDNFLDTLESKFGIQQVETLYQQAIDSIQGDPRGQQRLNKLMNDQLKLLRQKDKLTEYDVERAKAALEVEKARMAIEQARDSKTKMRLRRDSQGNYTYQYVADENKLSDLQQALNDAQANLYNIDKQHYTQNLNKIIDAYRDFQQKYNELSWQQAQANAAGDKEQAERIQARIDLLQESYKNLLDGLTEDNQYSLKYLAESFGSGMGFEQAQYKAEGFIKVMQQNIPHVGGEVQKLTNAIIADGGLLSALNQLMVGFDISNMQYVNGVQSYLAEAGTSVETIMKVADAYGNVMDTAINKAQEFIPYYDKMIADSVDAIDQIRESIEQVEKVLDKNLDDSSLVKTLETAVNLLQDLNRYRNSKTGQIAKDVNIKAPNVVDRNIDTTEEGAGVITAQDWKNYLNNQSTSQPITLASINAITQLDTDTLNSLSNSDLLLNVIGTVKYLTESMGSLVDKELAGLIKEASSYIGSIDNVETLNQNVHIEANFPNVRQHEEIKLAIQNLVNVASQKAMT